MKFSIITCTWNSEPYLGDSIASVLAQDYPDIEYIFVDGGSTDGTIERIQAIPRDVVFVTGVRGGISRAMNEGIHLATGDVIAHLHGDDYYLHDKVLSLVADTLRSTGAGWVFGRNKRNRGGVVEDETWVVPRYSYRRLLKRNWIPHESTFVRRELYERVGGFSEKWKYGMDYDMWLRLGKVSEPVQLDACLAVFREHGGSFSSANPRPAFEEDFRIRMSHASHAPWSWTYHGLHYLVRRHRMMRMLGPQTAPA
ncbi:MAG: glycosyltransferase [Burkholderiaceae bacterium]|nr:glycosyltransferase [Burkholderiaceae bacterium]